MCFAPQRRTLFRHFFDIWTSKSGPRPSVFNTFDLEMCFAPQRRARFQHLNFQKWSEAEVFCTFWLERIWKPWVTPYVVSCFLRNCLRKAYARAVLPYAGHSVWIELTRTLRLRVSCFHHRICLRSSTFSAWAIGVETCFEGIMLRKAINLIRASV